MKKMKDIKNGAIFSDLKNGHSASEFRLTEYSSGHIFWLIFSKYSKSDQIFTFWVNLITIKKKV